MKARSTIAIFAALTAIPLLGGCAAKAVEVELNVVFENEGNIVSNDTVTQFKNVLSPTIDAGYIPENYRFLGWTWCNEDELDLNDAAHFKTQYIGASRMVHYMDVARYAKNSTVVLNALIMHKDDIPKEYHYTVLAWYDKVANSGLNAEVMAGYETMLKNHLLGAGVSQADVDSIVIRGYAGNVGPTTGQILYDDDVDIMLGWGSVSNITTTGSIPESMIRETKEYQITFGGTPHARYIHRISDNANAEKVMEYLLSEESVNYFNQ